MNEDNPERILSLLRLDAIHKMLVLKSARASFTLLLPALLRKRGRPKVIGLEGHQPIEFVDFLIVHTERGQCGRVASIITNKGDLTELGADPGEGARDAMCAWCLQCARDRALSEPVQTRR